MPENRRVLVLNHFAVGAGQAGGTRHVELFGRLAGWDHLIVASDLNPQTGERMTSEPGLTLVPVPTFSSNGTRRVVNWVAYAGRAFATGVRQRDVDLVYGSSPHLLAAAAAWAVSFLKRRPFVMEVRDLWPQVLVDMGSLSDSSYIYRVLKAMEEFLYTRAAAIIVMAAGTEADLEGRGIAPEKIHLIPNGADSSEFFPSESRSVLRNRYQFTRTTFIYAGAHGPANGLDLLLDAAQQTGDLPVEFVLVGGGVEKRRLQQRVENEAILNVRFLDPVPKTEIADILFAADVGVHVLADVELFQRAVSPNKVYDYMAAGLPVLTNSPGMVADLVTTADAGWAAAPTGLAGVIRDMPRVGVKQYGDRGRRWLNRNQSRTMMSVRLQKVLDSVSGSGP